MKKNKSGRWGLLSDALIVCGAGLLTAGAAIIATAAGFVVAGCSCVLIGWLASMNGGES